ncbi:MAG TPA: hypothetical protein PLS28_05935, partial [Clostridiales bacterium]|nr:hypothetical protein [Clostridiales bacterium]
ACRLFFREDHPFSVIRKERPTPSYLTESYLEDKEFTHYLEMRDLALSLLSEQDVPMPKRLTQVSESVLGGASLEKDPRAALLQKLKPEDPWDTRWGEALKQLQETLPMMTPEREAIFLMRNEAELEPNFEKLSEYLAFRYFPDAYYLGNPVYAVNMLRRSIHLLYLFAFSYWWRGEQSSASDYRLTTEDFMQFCHLFSREVEHDDENIAALRGA